MSLALGEAEADAAEFSERLSSAAALTEAALEELLPPANLLGPRAPVAAAMRRRPFCTPGTARSSEAPSPL